MINLYQENSTNQKIDNVHKKAQVALK